MLYRVCLLGLFLLCNCTYNKFVDTYATLYWTVINKTESQVKVSFGPHREQESDTFHIGFDSKLILHHDTLYCDSGATINDTIGYVFKSADYCDITSGKAKKLTITVDVLVKDTLYKIIEVLPWNKTEYPNGFEELDNCHKESWDTITIE